MMTILKSNDLPKITLPALEKLDAYGATIQVLHPTLDNVWDMKDRINCPIEKAPGEIVQSRFYNDWKSDHYMAVVCVLYLTEKSETHFTMFLVAIMIIL